MKKYTMELPAMYGDHHVVEVRRLLLALPGVEDVYASSSFHTVEVSYDDGTIQPEKIHAILEDAGYLGELPIPVETDSGDRQNGQRVFFRHSAAFAETQNVVSFSQKVPYEGRPLWPCPGLGPIKDE